MKSYTLLDILDNSIDYLKEDKEVSIKLSGIKIPRIQRDYAQGREDEKNIRNRFLKAIFEHLDSEKEVMDLDFIYGSLKEFNNENFFTPLDGQQRLTTLFLLNWYIANVELQDTEELNEKKLFIDKLSHFSYETRPAAKNFCKKLVAFNFTLDPVSEIKNQMWFLEYYNQDPTISSMLNMLRSIHALYIKYEKKFYTRLSSLRFYIMPLDGFNLSDELYIKMNARGKQLSDFENFKADFISWMKNDENIHSVEFNKSVKYHSQMIPYYLSIASKLDNEWSDIFWSTRNQIDYDKGFFAFITRFALTHYSSLDSKTNNQIENSELFTSFTSLKDGKLDYKYLGFELFQQVLDHNVILSLEKVLDAISRNKEIINNCLSPLWDIENNWKLYSLDIIPRQYVLFYGIVQYLENAEFNEIRLKEWIRVLWNIAIDPKIRTFGLTISTIKSIIKPLIEFSNDINENLLSSELSSKLEDFIYNQNYEQSILYQEIEKAKKIKEDIIFKDLIYSAEAHPMFKGHISFIINAKNVAHAKQLKNAADSICVNQKGDLGKPSNYNWIRAVLILNDDLNLYLENNDKLTLLDGNFEQWNRLINNELRSGFYNLLLKFIEYNSDPVKSIINDFKFDFSKLWLWNLVKKTIVVDEEEHSLLYYSESKNVQYYYSNIYLFNKKNWTESNILLTSFRNQIISSLLLIERYHFESVWSNIDNQYYRGLNPEVYFNFRNFKISLIFHPTEVWIGIKRSDFDLVFDDDISWIDANNIENEIFEKHVIDFSDLVSLENIEITVNEIENYISNKYKL